MSGEETYLRDSAMEQDAMPAAGTQTVASVANAKTASSGEVRLSARRLSYTYPCGLRSVFTDMDVDLRTGEVLAILGNNGAGKSTMLDLFAGLTEPSSGEILVEGRHVSSLSRREAAQHIAYVAQQQLIPHLTVYDEVLLGRRPHISWSVTQEDRRIVADAIARMGLEDYADRFCDELSGGERQKVFIARALAQQPKVFLLDEPTSALDPRNQIEVLREIREITRTNDLACALVLHDVNLALRFCDVFLLMNDGRLVAKGGREQVTEEALYETYGTAFKLIDADGVPVAVPEDA